MGQSSSQIVSTQAPEPDETYTTSVNSKTMQQAPKPVKKRGAPASDDEEDEAGRRAKRQKPNGDKAVRSYKVHRAIPQHRRGTAIRPIEGPTVHSQQPKGNEHMPTLRSNLVPLSDPASEQLQHEEAAARAMRQEAVVGIDHRSNTQKVSRGSVRTSSLGEDGAIVNDIGKRGPPRRRRLKEVLIPVQAKEPKISEAQVQQPSPDSDAMKAKPMATPKSKHRKNVAQKSISDNADSEYTDAVEAVSERAQRIKQYQGKVVLKQGHDASHPRQMNVLTPSASVEDEGDDKSEDDNNELHAPDDNADHHSEHADSTHSINGRLNAENHPVQGARQPSNTQPKTHRKSQQYIDDSDDFQEDEAAEADSEAEDEPKSKPKSKPKRKSQTQGETQALKQGGQRSQPHTSSRKRTQPAEEVPSAPKDLKQFQSAARGSQKGTWTSEEKDVAGEMFRTYCELHEVDENFLRAKTVDWANIGPFKLQIYAAFPNRTIRGIRKFCQRHFSPCEKGDWTPDQDQQLRAAYATHPDSWHEIQDLINPMRSAEQCRSRWVDTVQWEEKMERGAWSTDEEEKLTKVVQERMTLIRQTAKPEIRDDPFSVESMIDWNSVATDMGGTRSAKRCREKWAKLKQRVVSGSIQRDTVVASVKQSAQMQVQVPPAQSPQAQETQTQTVALHSEVPQAQTHTALQPQPSPTLVLQTHAPPSQEPQEQALSEQNPQAQASPTQVTQIKADAVEPGLSKVQQRVDRIYATLEPGDIYDCLIEIVCAINETPGAPTKTFHDESTFWSVVGTVYPKSKSKFSIPRLRRRIYHGALERWGGKKVKRQERIQDRTAALVRRMMRWSGNGKVELQRGFRVDWVPGEEEKKTKESSKFEQIKQLAGTPTQTSSGEKVMAWNSGTALRPKPARLSEAVIVNSDDEIEEDAQAGADEQRGDIVSNSQQKTVRDEGALEVTETQDQENTTAAANNNAEAPAGEETEAVSGAVQEEEEDEIVDDLPVSPINSRNEQSLRSGTPMIHPSDFMKRCRDVGRKQHRVFMKSQRRSS